MSTYESIPEVTPTQAAALIDWALSSPSPIHVCLIGDPGTGKSRITEDRIRAFVAAHSDWEQWAGFYSGLTMRPEDGNGLPDVRGDLTTFVRSENLPPLDRRVICHVDEADKMDTDTVSVVSTLITEHRINNHRIHPDTRWVLTANAVENRAGGRELPSHLRDRLVMVRVVPSVKDWLTWGAANGEDPRVLAFHRYTQSTGETQHFSNFDPRATVSPSPRSWSQVSVILRSKPANPVPGVLEAMIEGQVGRAAASAFVGFLRIALSLPTPDRIKADPNGAPLPSQPAALHAAASMIAAEIAPQTAGAFLAYMQRIIDAGSAEIAAFFVIELEARKSPVMSTGEFVRWSTANPNVLPN